MRYIFAHALRGRGSRARCRPQAGKKGKAEGKPGNGIVAERRGRICGGRRSPQAQGAACAVPPAGCWRCVFPACGRHERSAGRRTARQGGVPGALRNLGRGGIQGAGSAKGPPGRRFGRKTTAEHPTPGTTRAGGTTKPASFSKGAGFSVPLGRGRP